MGDMCVRRFVLRQNIARYRERLDEPLAVSTRSLVERLLAEAEADLAIRQSIWLLTCPGVRINPLAGALVEKTLDAAIARCGADCGTVQLWDAGAQRLHLIAQDGFDQAFVDHFASVGDGDGSVCARAMASRAPVIVDDVETDQRFQALRQAVSPYGIRAIHSTPVLAADGRLLGMISTHFTSPRRSADYDGRVDVATDLRKLFASIHL